MRALALVALAFLVPLAACDSGEDGSPAATAELAESNAKISQAVSVGVSGGAGFREAAARSRPTYPCPGGGSADVTVSQTSYTMAFDDCYDVDGRFDVTYSYSYEPGASGIGIEFLYDGDLSVRNGCDVSYDNFGASVQTDGSEGSPTTLVYRGAVSASCPSGTTTCSFDGLSYEFDGSGNAGPSQADFEGVCR